MAGNSYFELQRKRLTIMQRAEFGCERRGAADKPLNVHHTYYEYGLDPWEYPACVGA